MQMLQLVIQWESSRLVVKGKVCWGESWANVNLSLSSDSSALTYVLLLFLKWYRIELTCSDTMFSLLNHLLQKAVWLSKHVRLQSLDSEQPDEIYNQTFRSVSGEIFNVFEKLKYQYSRRKLTETFNQILKETLDVERRLNEWSNFTVLGGNPFQNVPANHPQARMYRDMSRELSNDRLLAIATVINLWWGPSAVDEIHRLS